ncbi:MAG: HD domain-containing protein [Methermicoccaceae archaeon]
MVVIRDAIYGHVAIEPLALSVIDTPEMQRLRRVSQLGLCSLVYPGANHTRFEHSLGCYHLASKLEAISSDYIGVEDAHLLDIACLLHDVGHPPLSHTLERVLNSHDGLEHTSLTRLIGKGELSDLLDDAGYPLTTIEKVVCGNGGLGALVSGEIDLDRMDYLRRDAYYTGVAYGIVDTDHLLSELRLADILADDLTGGSVVLGKGALHAAESLLLSRFLMYPTVYSHHVPRIAGCMLSHDLSLLLGNGALTTADVRNMDDHTLIQAMLRGGEGLGEPMLTGDVLSRKLYKRAVFSSPHEIEMEPDRLMGKEDEVAQEIVDEAGVDDHQVLVEIPPMPRMEETHALLDINGDYKRLDELSSFVGTIEKAHRDSWRLGVYAPPDVLEEVRRAAVNVLGVRRSVQTSFLDNDNNW